MAKKRKRPLWVPIVKTVTVLLTLALIYLAGSRAVEKYVVFAGGRPVLLTGSEVDLRSSRVSIEEYEELAAKMEDAQILWCVPIGGQYHESTSEYIILENLTEAEIPNFAYLPNLQTVDAGNCDDHAALAALEAALPEVEIKWNVHLGGKSFPRDAEKVDVSGTDVTAAELENALPWFGPGTQVVMGDTALTAQEKLRLREAFPDYLLAWDIQVLGRTYSAGEEKLQLAGENFDLAELIAAADQFIAMKEVDVSGCQLSMEDLLALQEAFPDALIRTEITVHGKKVSTDITELDLSGIKMKDTAEVERAAKLMKNLKKVIMCDCGISNEKMDELNRMFPDTQFVWT